MFMADDGGGLDALLSSPHLALVGIDRAGLIEGWSEGARVLFGWSAAESLGQPVTMLAPPDQHSDLAARCDAVVSGGQELPAIETLRHSKSGEGIAVHEHVLPVMDERGQPVGGLALYHDIRAAGGVSTALSDSNQELQARFQRSPVPQGRLSLDAQVLAVNAAMSTLLGRAEAELVGSDGLQLVHEDDREAVVLVLLDVASGDATHVQLEARLLTTAGARYAVLTGTAVPQQSGDTVLAVSAQDVTELRAAEEAVRVQAARFEAVLSTLPVVVFSYDCAGRCTFSRGLGLEAFGLQQDELVGADLFAVYADHPAGVDALRHSLKGEAATVTLEIADRTITVGCRPWYDEAGELIGGLGISVDITERVQAEREVQANEARLRSLLQHASDIAFVVDEDGAIAYVSPAVRLQLGYAEDQLIGVAAIELDHAEDRELVAGAWRAVAGQSGATAACECRVRHADGSWVWTEQIFTNLLDDPVIRGVVVNVRETTARRRVEEDLRRLALQDGLTGLANRTLLLDRLRLALNRERRAESRTGLIVLDVVGMQGLNQRWGQECGDAVLREVASRLQAAVRDSDSLARIGGDVFAVLVENVASMEDLRAQTATLLEVVDEPVLTSDGPVEVRMRAGSAVSPAADAGALLASAERAAFPEAGPAGIAEPAQVAELRAAIASGQLRLHYQPVLALASDEVSGVEALVRWEHPTRGLVPPSEFIPLAERSGLVVELGEWVLREALTSLARWQRAGRDWSVGVNLSPRQLVGTDFPDVVKQVLAETGAAAERLVIEVTESTLMDDPAAPAVLNALRLMGVRLALDDFGTGYSSLTYLRRFTVDSIKIDRSFVAGLGRDPDDDAIVASIVSLAGAVGKLVVAEGVETIGQLQALRDLGVAQAQGFLWTRPLALDQLEVWLDDRPQLRAVAEPPTAAAATATVTAHAPAVLPGSDEARILELHLQGASLHTVAAALNAEGRRTPAGPRWTTTTVARVIAELVRTTSPGGSTSGDAS
jgi:diguanylate cyclase (GGDEF)-like protein/PAS domain S-box-containing protein